MALWCGVMHWACFPGWGQSARTKCSPDSFPCFITHCVCFTVTSQERRNTEEWQRPARSSMRSIYMSWCSSQLYHHTYLYTPNTENSWHWDHQMVAHILQRNFPIISKLCIWKKNNNNCDLGAKNDILRYFQICSFFEEQITCMYLHFPGELHHAVSKWELFGKWLF